MSIRCILPLLCSLIATTAAAQTSWQWEYVVPFQPYSSLRDVVHLGGGELLAIDGTYGQLASSSDSGRSWSFRSHRGLVLAEHLAFADSLHGIVALEHGSYLRTEDAGRTWKAINPAMSHAHPSDVAYNRNGVILQVQEIGWNRRHVVNRSTDNGITWEERRTEDSTKGLIRVRFVDDQVALLGTTNAIYRSTDAGASWSPVVTGLEGGVFGLDVAPGGYGIASTPTRILSTTDKGSTWNDITPPDAGIRFGLIATIGPERLLVVSPDSSHALTSSDAGATWVSSVIDTNDSRQIHYAVTLVDASTAVAVGLHTSIHRSSDGARSWGEVIKAFTAPTHDIAFNADGRGFIVGYGGRIYESDDRGRRWYPRHSITDSTLYAITFDGKNGVAVGAGVALRTDDGGATWEHATRLPSDVVLKGVDMNSSGLVLAVGDDGVIVQSSDRGREWDLVHRNSVPDEYESGLLPDIEILDSLHAVAVRQGTIIRTSDGGATWIETPVADSAYFSVEFTDPLNGSIGAAETDFFGYFPFMLHTSDGGVTWHDAPYPWVRPRTDVSEFVSDIHYLDPLHGIGLGWGGMLETFDAGRSWQRTDSTVWPQRFDMLGDSVIVGLDVYGRVVRGTRAVPARAIEWPIRTTEAQSAPTLHANLPNPFSARTIIPFSLPSSGHVTLTIENARGERVAILVDGVLEAGDHQAIWNGSDAPAGLYFTRLRQIGQEAVGRIVRR